MADSAKKTAAVQALRRIASDAKKARIADRLGEKAPTGFMVRIGIVPADEAEEEMGEEG